MPDSLLSLEHRRAELLRALANLNDMRPGSIVGAVWRCGKPICHCAQPDDPGHGPTLRLTYKRRGKTVTQALPTPAAVRKAKQEIAEFRRYQQLSHELVEVSEQVYRLRPAEEETARAQERKRRLPSNRKSPRSRATAAHDFRWHSQYGPAGFGSRRDAGALGPCIRPERAH